MAQAASQPLADGRVCYGYRRRMKWLRWPLDGPFW